MIGRIDIRANAAHPNFPIPPVYMFAGAPSSPRVFGVPCRVGSWAITAVSVAVAYPDNSTRTVSLTQADGTWIGVIPACATTGAVQNGVQIVADGTDENGDAVTGYCLGVGDLFVMERDFTATADGTRYYFHYCEEVPATPQVGDAAYTGGVLKWFDGTAWRDFGGGHDAAKLDGAAAYPEWVQGDDYEPPDIVSHKGRLWRCQNYTIAEPGEEPLSDWLEVSIEVLKQDALSDAQMDAVNSGATAAKVATWDGYAAQIAQKANAADVNAALALKANATDLPYALVTPGEWEFSGVPSGAIDVAMSWNGSRFAWVLEFEVGGITNTIEGMSSSGENALSVHLEDEAYTITATRPSLPGHLLDRAVNAVAVSAATELTMPVATAGKVRDFLVRLEISGSTVPTITFAAPTGETITYETDGDDFPVPDEAGTWLYSFTETEAHTFAVSLKKVNIVAQGGS